MVIRSPAPSRLPTLSLTDGTIFSIESGDQASHGTATIDPASGAWASPEADYFGSDAFTVTISDDLGGTTEQQIDLTC